ncbi:MAG: pentapeptide repeat-containing protein, partial [Cyanobacteriota bacterium]|nr:pentapeptide repeat-containing protein [Cyanobacteriota bacterium]
MSFKIYNSNYSLNFSGKNLKGISFKKRNLKGANFSGSDIRGANFTGANLTNANFSNTKAGLNKYWIVVSFLLSLITGFHTGAKAIHFYNLLFNKIYYEQIVGAIALTGYIAFLIISRWQGFVNAFMKVVLTAVLTGLLGGIISLAFNQEIISEIIISTVADFNQGIVSAVFITSFLALMIAITNTNVIISYLTTSVITAILIPLLAGDRISQNSWFSIPIITGLTVLIMLVCADISKRILAGDENYAFIRRVVIAAAVSGGTSFRGADLSGANFTGANLRNTDFPTSASPLPATSPPAPSNTTRSSPWAC